MQMDLFEMLGLEPVEEKVEKKTVAKTAKPEKKATTTNSSVESVELPVMVILGTQPVISMTGKDFGDEAAKSVAISKVVELVAARYGVEKTVLVSKKLAKDKLAVVLDRKKVFVKGKAKITQTSIIKVGEEEFSLGEFAEQTEADVADIKKFLREKVDDRVSFKVIQSGENLFAVAGDVPAAAVDLPLTVINLTGETKTYNSSDFELEDGEAVTLAAVEELVFSSPELSEQKEVLSLYYGEKDGKPDHSVLVIGVKEISSSVTTAKTEETYPTDAVISLVFNRIQLSPDMFGGKEQATAAEVIAILSKDYPEFTKDRTKLTYDKKGNYIFPTLKSSTKGSTLYKSLGGAIGDAARNDYFLCRYFTEAGYVGRLEKTKVSLTAADGTGDGLYEYYLPKVPMKMIMAIKEFFRMVAERQNTEALVWLLYDESARQYKVIVPQQITTVSSVHTEDFLYQTPDYYKVADIHSHGAAYKAFFSMQDDFDEKSNLIYGVMGDMCGEEQMLFRAGTGGKYVKLSLNDFVEESESPLGFSASDLYNEFLQVSCKAC